MKSRSGDIHEIMAEEICRQRELSSAKRHTRDRIPLDKDGHWDGFSQVGGRSEKRRSNASAGNKSKRRQHLDHLKTLRKRERENYLPKWRPLAELVASLPIGGYTVQLPPDGIRAADWAQSISSALKQNSVNIRLRFKTRTIWNAVRITRVKDWPVSKSKPTRLERSANVEWFRFVNAMKHIVRVGNVAKKQRG